MSTTHRWREPLTYEERQEFIAALQHVIEHAPHTAALDGTGAHPEAGCAPCLALRALYLTVKPQ